LKLEKIKSDRKNRGFYIALGVCLIAVGAAAWTTYDSVTDYTAPQTDVRSEAAKANNTVSGIFITEPQLPDPASAEPAAEVQSTAPSAAPAESEPAVQTEAKPAAAVSYSAPVSGEVLQPFSKKAVYNKTLGDYRAHTGVDLKAAAGERVAAIADGVVTSVRSGGEAGNSVLVKHGDLEAWYCGLDQISVQEGQNVAQGQQLGTVGVNPSEASEESHLHFAVIKDGQYLDPMTLLK
jgi:murein DD-endopeptidase MepM/ murein hydrolase activator NlpD